MTSKIRAIFITDWGSRDLSLTVTINPSYCSRELGMQLLERFYDAYEVIDEPKFMLAVVKHGIQWIPVPENIVLEKAKAALDSCR